MKQLLEILNRTDIRRIAVWGKGGIGKTILVKNLSNLLYFSSPNSFDIVIWVQVSRELDLSTIQSQIAKRIHLKVEAGDTTHNIAIRILRRLKLRRKILLILDDVWEKIDLDAMGIPSRDPCCKVLLTTRSRDVCRDMAVDVSFPMNLMNEEDAWDLFNESAGPIIGPDGRESPARKIVADCHGLPLAIKTLGKFMRDRPQIELWRNTALWRQCSSPLFKNIEKEVFRPLEMSYHYLPSKILKQCFLYCSLYPASFSIDVAELIQCWVSDGLINENQSMAEAFNYGVALVEHLKDSCLLDQDGSRGTVKMHDIFHDSAIRLSEREELYGFHCQSGVPFHQMPKESSRRFSLMGCRIEKLQAFPVCSQLTVLLLQGNPIKRIPDDFFQNVKSLRVLNLSNTRITALPPSFLCLGELRALFLRGCNLMKLPSLKALGKLLVLDLSSTLIRELPRGLGSLSSLRELNLSCTHFLEKAIAGSILGLSSLETLDVSFSAYNWNMKTGADQRARFDELLSLDHLSVLRIRLDSVERLASTVASSWLKKLTRYDIHISPRSFDSNYHVAQHNEKRLVLRGVDLLQEDLRDVLYNTSSLDMLTCVGMTQRHWLSLSSLISLTISNCDDITCLINKESSSQVMFPNLQHLVLDHLKNLVTTVESILPRGKCLSNLKTIHVLDCPMLRGAISYAMLRHVGKLEEIKVSGCENMCRIIESGGHAKTLAVLRVINISNMVNLTSICDGTSVCPVLEQIEVSGCWGLKKLPLSISSSCSLKEIRGDIEWWNNLTWENDVVKRYFEQHFQACPREENCSRKRKYKNTS
ncbi:Disease resistance protein [Cynara cardunculus var. scolymus]|uniref:Disease resistance protein n=2 Tax=Cynara cardunculus var. scolymus TaxID=59895 RepID=A0A103YJV6_CYNCS|nr:Disease resistance protein [Cynara cardunculus var. scolymus]